MKWTFFDSLLLRRDTTKCPTASKENEITVFPLSPPKPKPSCLQPFDNNFWNNSSYCINNNWLYFASKAGSMYHRLTRLWCATTAAEPLRLRKGSSSSWLLASNSARTGQPAVSTRIIDGGPCGRVRSPEWCARQPHNSRCSRPRSCVCP